MLPLFETHAGIPRTAGVEAAPEWNALPTACRPGVWGQPLWSARTPSTRPMARPIAKSNRTRQGRPRNRVRLLEDTGPCWQGRCGRFPLHASLYGPWTGPNYAWLPGPHLSAGGNRPGHCSQSALPSRSCTWRGLAFCINIFIQNSVQPYRYTIGIINERRCTMHICMS